jgi:hypothetical protein
LWNLGVIFNPEVQNMTAENTTRELAERILVGLAPYRDGTPAEVAQEALELAWAFNRSAWAIPAPSPAVDRDGLRKAMEAAWYSTDGGWVKVADTAIAFLARATRDGGAS